MVWPGRLDPAGFEAAVDGAARIGPIGHHPRDQPEIVHAMHDDAAETGFAETALHVIVVEMQRVVVERGVAEQADRFAADREFWPLDAVPGLEAFKRRRHDRVPLTRPDGPAAARTDHRAMLVEEDIVVHHEQPFALDELVERARLEPDDVVRTR